jgi:hypothetical protein
MDRPRVNPRKHYSDRVFHVFRVSHVFTHSSARNHCTGGNEDKEEMPLKPEVFFVSFALFCSTRSGRGQILPSEPFDIYRRHRRGAGGFAARSTFIIQIRPPVFL